ncbi:hypothetical protein OIE70_05255 [Streptomyces sp. NBC_01744]|nr:hypothetical protein [Streptomyces sp. NBC_01761]WSC51720.1 hypothetical protein OG808_05130 [Streptomyces sp. NBC_01761]WSF82568.1 hypothetical protein OIE70_05255 [Streptomyces sp. NBC_01744]
MPGSGRSVRGAGTRVRSAATAAATSSGSSISEHGNSLTHEPRDSPGPGARKVNQPRSSIHARIQRRVSSSSSGTSSGPAAKVTYMRRSSSV